MQSNVLDIGSKAEYPAKVLSNFASWSFTFDGVECASMEGFLQSLKFDKAHIQPEICKLTGIAAKNRGKERNSNWKNKNGLWWKGEFYQRRSEEYQRLLDRAYLQLAIQNSDYQKALIDTKDLILTHKIGRASESDTVLTQKEFCSRLMKLRNLIRKGNDLNNVTRL